MHTCDEYNNCDSCNPGYKLEQGKCILNYSFKALYQTSSPNQSVTLFGDFKVVIKEMTIDGEKVEFCQSYTFENAGEHTVFVLLDLSLISTLKNFFAQSEMKSITFSEKFNTETIEYMNGMFKYCNNLTSINLSYFNTKNVKDMEYMFYECSSFISLDLSNFNTRNVLTMKSMFRNCKKLQFINITEFDTSKVREMTEMFENCTKLKSLDLSNFNTQNVKNMTKMFRSSSSLISLDLSSFDT